MLRFLSECRNTRKNAHILLCSMELPLVLYCSSPFITWRVWHLQFASLQGERWVSLRLKSAEAIILITIELSSDQDTFLLSPWFYFTWEDLDADRLVQGKPGNHLMRPHFLLQPQVHISHVMEGQSGRETSGCISKQKFTHC